MSDDGRDRAPRDTDRGRPSSRSRSPDDRPPPRRRGSRSVSRSRSPDRRPERPVYCGNYEYDMPESEIRYMFEEFGEVERIDMKTGFCFVYMMSSKAVDRAVRKLHGKEVGRRRRPLHVQLAKTKEADRSRVARPSTTLFVVNFDIAKVTERDIERHFDSYGKIKRVEIKKSYAFVQYENLDDATYAMKKTHLSNLLGRTITVLPEMKSAGRDEGSATDRPARQVEYVQNEDPNAARERGPQGYGGGGSRDRERGYDRGYDRDRGGERDRDFDRGRSPPPRRSRSRSPRARSYSR